MGTSARHFYYYYFLKSFPFPRFHEIIPRREFLQFNEREVELLLCGTRTLDLTDWRKHTMFVRGGGVATNRELGLHKLHVRHWFAHDVAVRDAGTTATRQSRPSCCGSGRCWRSLTRCARRSSCSSARAPRAFPSRASRPCRVVMARANSASRRFRRDKNEKRARVRCARSVVLPNWSNKTMKGRQRPEAAARAHVPQQAGPAAVLVQGRAARAPAAGDGGRRGLHRRLTGASGRGGGRIVTILLQLHHVHRALVTAQSWEAQRAQASTPLPFFASRKHLCL